MTALNKKSFNNGEGRIRTVGPSYPGQLLSRQLHSATLPPLQKNFKEIFLEKSRHQNYDVILVADSPLVIFHCSIKPFILLRPVIDL